MVDFHVGGTTRWRKSSDERTCLCYIRSRYECCRQVPALKPRDWDLFVPTSMLLLFFLFHFVYSFMLNISVSSYLKYTFVPIFTGIYTRN